jgi:hypothetical protein
MASWSWSCLSVNQPDGFLNLIMLVSQPAWWPPETDHGHSDQRNQVKSLKTDQSGILITAGVTNGTQFEPTDTPTTMRDKLNSPIDRSGSTYQPSQAMHNLIPLTHRRLPQASRPTPQLITLAAEMNHRRRWGNRWRSNPKLNRAQRIWRKCWERIALLPCQSWSPIGELCRRCCRSRACQNQSA